jgi:hypothetical protein
LEKIRVTKPIEKTKFLRGFSVSKEEEEEEEKEFASRKVGSTVKGKAVWSVHIFRVQVLRNKNINNYLIITLFYS